MAERHIYFISGLGATRVAFENTIVPEGWKMHFIDWIEIASEEEDLDSYVNRLNKQVKHKNPIFSGLSFGGIMAMELTKKHGGSFAIMISSFRDKGDLTFPIRSMLNMKAYKLIPNVEMNSIRSLVRKAYAVSSKVTVDKLMEMMGDESPQFLRWASRQIDEYKFELPEGVKLHPIVGTKDKLVNPWEDHKIDIVEKGTHIAVYANYKEVNNYISKILDSYV